jgi:hypothetical protein
MTFYLIDLRANLPSLLLQREVSICMSDKLKALSIDLHGTFLAGESLSDRNQQAVSAAYKKGYHIVIATSRGPSQQGITLRFQITQFSLTPPYCNRSGH